MREPELVESVRRTFGAKARLTVTQAARLIEAHGHMACMMAVPEMVDRRFEWDAEVFGGVCAETARTYREQQERREREAWAAHVAECERQRRDPGSRGFVAAMRSAMADMLAGRITRRERVRLQLAALRRHPPAPWRDEQILEFEGLLLTEPDEFLRPGPLIAAMAAAPAMAQVAAAEAEEVPF